MALYRNVKSGKIETIDSSVKTYLFGIGKNIVLNNVKRKAIENRVLASVETGTDDRINDNHQLQHITFFVRKLYEGLGSPCREILLMFYEKGYDMQQIASATGYKNADVAKKKKYECLKALEDRVHKSKLINIFR